MKSNIILEKIRNKLKEVDPDKRSILKIFQFNFTDTTDEVIKRVVIDCKALTVYELEEGTTTPSMDAIVTVNDENFYLVGTKTCTFDDLLANDKAKVEGDMEALRKMMDKMRTNASN